MSKLGLKIPQLKIIILNAIMENLDKELKELCDQYYEMGRDDMRRDMLSALQTLSDAKNAPPQDDNAV